jgi:hypothetical protein
VLVLALSLGPVGCHAKGDATESVAAQPLPPVPPPPSLLAEGTFRTPDTTWQRLQRGLGGGAGILPSTLGGLICALSAVDPRLAPAVDGQSPAYAVVAGSGGDAASRGWVVSARLVEERRVRPLFEGAEAAFDAHDAGGGMTVISAKGRVPGAGPVAALVPGGWLAVGSSPSALVALAPYATRTLPTKPVSAEALSLDLLPEALAGPLSDALKARWQGAKEKMLADDRALRETHGGRAPDYGDPAAIVAALDVWVQRHIAALGDVRGAHVSGDVGDTDIRFTLTASPASPGGPASSLLGELRTGDLAPLGGLPRDAVFAFLSRSDAAGRAKDAAGFESLLAGALGSRLLPADEKTLRAALDHLTAARGDWLAGSLGVDPRDSATGKRSADFRVLFEAATSDPAGASRAVREGIDAAMQAQAIRQPLATWLSLSSPAYRSVDLGGGAQGTLAAFGAPLSMAWAARGGELAVAASPSPLALLAPPAAGATLADDPDMRATLQALGPVAAALVVQPGRATPGCAASGVVALAWGARAPQTPQTTAAPAFVGELTATDSALRCLARGLF